MPLVTIVGVFALLHVFSISKSQSHIKPHQLTHPSPPINPTPNQLGGNIELVLLNPLPSPLISPSARFQDAHAPKNQDLLSPNNYAHPAIPPIPSNHLLRGSKTPRRPRAASPTRRLTLACLQAKSRLDAFPLNPPTLLNDSITRTGLAQLQDAQRQPASSANALLLTSRQVHKHKATQHYLLTAQLFTPPA